MIVPHKTEEAVRCRTCIRTMLQNRINLRARASVPDHTLDNDSVCDTLVFATYSFNCICAWICCESDQVRFSVLERNMYALNRERAGAAGNRRGSSCRSVRKRYRRLAADHQWCVIGIAQFSNTFGCCDSCAQHITANIQNTSQSHTKLHTPHALHFNFSKYYTSR